MEYLKSAMLGDKIKHAFTLRYGGVSKGNFESLNLGFDTDDAEENIKENYKIFCNEFGLDRDKLIMAHQEHSDKVMVIKDNIGLTDFVDQRDLEFETKFGLKNIFLGVDGFITNKPGLALIVRFADCQGILMYDPKNKIIAAVHSGWRGNSKNIVGKAIDKMRAEFGTDSANLLVAVSSSLGPCCAKFSKPYEELPEFMHKYIKDFKVDLWQCTFDHLLAMGVRPENIDMTRKCTVCENDKFFSYRGGKGVTGHMAGMIQL